MNCTQSKQLKILLLGGTGAMGTHLASILINYGYSVHITTRSQRQDRDGIRYIVGDAHSTSFLKSLVLTEYYDAIVDFMVYDTQQFCNSERQSIISDLANQYVFISSARVFAYTDGLITETSQRHLDVTTDRQFINSDIYPITKARQEDILRNTSLNWTIVRPYITFSEIRIQLGVLEKEQWLVRALKGKKIYFSEDIGQAITTLTYAQDVAHGIESLIDNPKAYHEDFNIMTSETHSWQEIASIYDTIFRERVADYKGIYWDTINIMRDFGDAKWAIEYDRVLPRKFDNSKILSVNPRLKFNSVQEKLAQCLNEFLDNPCFLQYSPTLDPFFDRRTGDWGLKQQASLADVIKYTIRRVAPLSILKYRANKKLNSYERKALFK